MTRKISDHLEAPMTCIVQQRTEQMAAARDADLYNQGGTASYSADGWPEIEVSIAQPTFKVWSPAAAHYAKTGQRERSRDFVTKLADELTKGITIELGRRGGWQLASTAQAR